MKTDAELDALSLKLYWHNEHGETRHAIKLLRSIEIAALREVRGIMTKTKSWDFCMESEECDNPALPELNNLIRELELR